MTTDTPETDAHHKRYLRDDSESEDFWMMDLRGLARKLERERNELRGAVSATIMENLHLADGDNCTLKRLKDAIGFELPPLA